MLLVIKFFAKLLSILNGEISPKQIAAGFAFGALIGLIPVKGLLPLALLLLAFIVNVNLPMLFLASAVFKIISFAVDPLANQLGFVFLVQSDGLKGFWTSLYNTPVIPFTWFNNTIVLGSLVIGLVLLVPLYFIARMGVEAYRTKFRDKVMKFKIVQIFKASRLYRFYLSYKGITQG